MFKRLILSKTLRRRVHLIIAVVIIFPFVIFFSSVGRPPAKGPGGSAGVLFGRRIPWETFQQEQEWLGRRWTERVGEMPESMKPLLVQSTWDRFILLAEAKRQRLRVDDKELAALIQHLPAFHEHGRFLPERYHGYVASIHMTPETFEASLRRDLLVEKLLNRVKNAVAVTDEEVRATYAEAHERLKGSILLVDPASFMEEAAKRITEEAVRAEYDAHPEVVRIPAQLSIEYAGASREQLSAHVQLHDEDLSAFYEDHPERFTDAEGRTKPFAEVRDAVRQQLLDERVRKQLTALALDLQDDVEANRPFEEIVKTRALSPHTAGPLATDSAWAPGGLDPAVLQAVAKLKEGQMSDVIQSEQGVCIARVTQRIPSRLPPLEEVRTKIRERLAAARAKELAAAHAKTLHTQLQEQLTAGLSFDEAAHKLGLSELEPPPFTRADPIDLLGAVPSANAAAFATPVGQLTRVLETPTSFVLVMVRERLPADLAAFTAEEQKKLREQILAEKQQARTMEWLADLRAHAKLQSFIEDTTEPQKNF